LFYALIIFLFLSLISTSTPHHQSALHFVVTALEANRTVWQDAKAAADRVPVGSDIVSAGAASAAGALDADVIGSYGFAHVPAAVWFFLFGMICDSIYIQYLHITTTFLSFDNCVSSMFSLHFCRLLSLSLLPIPVCSFTRTRTHAHTSHQSIHQVAAGLPASIAPWQWHYAFDEPDAEDNIQFESGLRCAFHHKQYYRHLYSHAAFWSEFQRQTCLACFERNV
jgi:hypothetical protein